MTFLDLPTPALLVDLDVLDRNIAAAAAVAQQCGVALRPHIKTHKCPAIACRQRNAGAIGLTVATISEAEAMTDAGHDDIFIARPVLGIAALARLHALRARATIAVAVDHADAVQPLVLGGRTMLANVGDVTQFGGVAVSATYAEPGQGAPPATASVFDKINYLYKAWRNKKTQTDSQFSLYADDGTTIDQKCLTSDDGTTTTVGEVVTGA